MRAVAALTLLTLAACAGEPDPVFATPAGQRAVAYCRYQASRAPDIESDIGTMSACLRYFQATGEVPR